MLAADRVLLRRICLATVVLVVRQGNPRPRWPKCRAEPSMALCDRVSGPVVEARASPTRGTGVVVGLARVASSTDAGDAAVVVTLEVLPTVGHGHLNK